MTLKKLNQYQNICKEIVELNVMIKDKTVYGMISGSDISFPHLQHTIAVSGVENIQENDEMLAKVHMLEIQKQDIENFVDSIDDSLTRRIFRLRFINGFSWIRTALKIGGDNTAASVKMLCYRYIKSKQI